ncbi:hypothetical protein [Yersinia similis]|uniref:hypothetical protein n=1 Tax=Yersinia similis TaxID=367190 RepID=UPI000B0D8F0F|nr:hypothetical protein [Yersinia similis]
MAFSAKLCDKFPSNGIGSAANVNRPSLHGNRVANVSLTVSFNGLDFTQAIE